MSTRPTKKLDAKWTTFEVYEYITVKERNDAGQKFRDAIYSGDVDESIDLQTAIVEAAKQGKTQDAENVMLEYIVVKVNDQDVTEKKGQELRAVLEELPATDVDVLLAHMNDVFGGADDEKK